VTRSVADPVVITRPDRLRHALDADRAAGRSVGFVPTMGYLHDGHAALLARARASDETVVASIFVNPLQFGQGEDYEAYPRDLERDATVVARQGVDMLFVPEADDMYPGPVRTTVTVVELSEPLEGQQRPAHFAGVATVVAKLLNIVGPCRAYFGEKDFQQLLVVRQMVRDLSFPVEVVGCPTVREHDGLALSSRNSYLTPEDRAAAPVIHRALQAGAAAIAAGERDGATVHDLMATIIDAEPRAELDYVAVRDADSLATLERIAGNIRLLAAVRFGRARLIDNVGVTV
jgi:pantoate--beta-alanine ligase